MDELRFDGKVAIITGAGGGLGRSHALLFGSRGAKVVVNDLGGSASGEGSSRAADKVVEEIRALGGEAVANYDSVEDGAKIVRTAIDAFGRVDVLVNNAGILRDASFAKLTDAEWDIILRIHLTGSMRVTHAAWPYMREQGYGRIVMTTSAAGIYGNFGQTNYSAAKLGLFGFANSLAVEGKTKNILVNTIAPIAASRLTDGILPPDLLAALKPEYVSPLVAFLCHESTEDTGRLFEVGGGLVNRLRWERSKGWSFPAKNGLTPEQVAGKWSTINDFAGADHPASVADSIQALMAALEKPKRGGNEFIDLDAALAQPPVVMESSYDERDVSLYALGVGAGSNPLDESELKFVHERGDTFHVLPTYGCMPALNSFIKAMGEGKQPPGMNVGFDRVLHGEQYTEIKRPLPKAAKLRHEAKLRDAYDKGQNAVGIIDVRTFDEDGDEVALNEITFFLKGAGGWGGDRGPSVEVNVPPSRDPDAVIEEKIGDDQALIYRLSGDWNPLHVDPSFAKAFGFDRPILHGLCTFGYVGRHVLKAFCNNDPRRFKSIRVRFAKSVYPGQTLVTKMWKASDQRIVFETSVKDTNEVVIKNAAVELYSEIPAPKAKAKTANVAVAAPVATSVAPAAAGAITPAIAFSAIGKYIAANPEVVQKAKAVVQFALTDPDARFVMDLKNGAGGTRAGEVEKPDVTMTVTSADFLDICAGKADAQKLFFAGKVKLAGNMMVAQKLDFLRKIDPKFFDGAAGETAPTAATAPKTAAPASASGASAKPLFEALAERLSKSPGLAKEFGAVYQFVVEDQKIVVDLVKAGVRHGYEANADVILSIAADDILALAKGSAAAADLYQRGKLRVDGDVARAHRLSFLHGLV